MDQHQAEVIWNGVLRGLTYGTLLGFPVLLIAAFFMPTTGTTIESVAFAFAYLIIGLWSLYRIKHS